ncbi:MAG: SUF system NifU family Fe-S cluster assembly protein [Gammaproteobacteria bacterium]|nr:SUF system NifU family Fe-S cluster assembly protein [Gammaproteobacteria bacterium]
MNAQPTELQDLYRNTVLEHSRTPRNFGRIDDADRQAEGHNPLCGDKLTVYLKIPGDHIDTVHFEGVGCAICMASASLMTEVVAGQSIDAARNTSESVLGTFADPDRDAENLPGQVPALAGVRSYPSRIKCATLPWKTLIQALSGESLIATTE